MFNEDGGEIGGQDYYNRVLKDINASLRRHRRSSIQKDEQQKIHREDSRQSLSSQRNDSRSNIEGLIRSSTKPTLQNSPSTGALKKSASRVTLDSR